MPMQSGKPLLPRSYRRYRLPLFILCIGMVVLLLGVGFWTVLLHNQNAGSAPIFAVSPTPTSNSSLAGATATTYPSMASTVHVSNGVVSPFIFGTNLSLYDNNDQVLHSASTRVQLQAMHFRIMRFPVRAALSNETEIQAARIIRGMGAYAVVVLRGAVDTNALADDTRIIQDMNSVYEHIVVFYEYGNEEDLLGVNVDRYTASWNAIVPQLKHIALNGQFIGPVNYQYDRDYLTAFLQHAQPRPDAISWHEYTCDDDAPNDSCLANIDNWTEHIANARSTMQASVGATLPIMITEWNYAPNAQANDGKINDSNFMAAWTTKALQTLAANRVFASMQYTCTNSVYALVRDDSTSSIQGLTIRDLYQSMILDNRQPTPVSPAQIVFVSSGVHYPGSQDVMSRLTGVTPPRYRDARALAWPEQHPDAGERNETPQTVGTRRYSTSKLCDLFYAYELSRRLQLEGYSAPEHPIAVNAFDPGLMPGTQLARDHGAFERFAWNVILPALRFALPNTHSPNASGKALARLVLDPALESISGKYFEGTRERASSEESYNQQEAAELWKASAELVKLLPTETILRVESSVDEEIS